MADHSGKIKDLEAKLKQKEDEIIRINKLLMESQKQYQELNNSDIEVAFIVRGRIAHLRNGNISTADYTTYPSEAGTSLVIIAN